MKGIYLFFQGDNYFRNLCQNKCATVERRWILKSDILALKFQLLYLIVVTLGEIMFLSLRPVKWG